MLNAYKRPAEDQPETAAGRNQRINNLKNQNEQLNPQVQQTQRDLAEAKKIKYEKEIELRAVMNTPTPTNPSELNLWHQQIGALYLCVENQNSKVDGLEKTLAALCNEQTRLRSQIRYLSSPSKRYEMNDPDLSTLLREAINRVCPNHPLSEGSPSCYLYTHTAEVHIHFDSTTYADTVRQLFKSAGVPDKEITITGTVSPKNAFYATIPMTYRDAVVTEFQNLNKQAARPAVLSNK